MIIVFLVSIFDAHIAAVDIKVTLRLEKKIQNIWKPRSEAEPQQVVDVMPLHCLQYLRSHNVFYIGLPVKRTF